MTTPTIPNPLDALARLAEVRTVRTDQLRARVHALLASLDDLTEVGDTASAGGVSIERVEIRSNVGRATFWRQAVDEDDGYGRRRGVQLDHTGDGYLHGDYGCPLHGAEREHLLEFARHAGTLVADLIARHQACAAALEGAIASVAAAMPG